MDLAALRAEQLALAQQVCLSPKLDLAKIRYIAGTDVGFEQEGAITRAAIVILDYHTLQPVEYQIARIQTTFPYIPGYLSFREFPALQAAWQQLQIKPDLLMVDGQGIAHPRGIGIAAHLGVKLNMPTVGVAKKRLFGTHCELNAEAGSCVALMDKQSQQIGWVLRSKLRCNPLYISPGNQVSLAQAKQLVEHCLQGYRLPEPTRWADAIASRKKLFLNWQQAQ